MLVENLTGLLVLLFGYGYPAFECFKMLEQQQHPSSSRQLQFWCQYWIIVAILTMIEMLGDFLLPLLPTYYSQAKLVFLVYLWHPKTMGSDVVYEAFLRPLVMQYEPDIEERLRNLRADSGQLLIFYLKNFTEKGQRLFMEALRYAVSKAESRSSQRVKRSSSMSRPSTKKESYPSTKEEEESRPSIRKEEKRHGTEKLEEKEEKRHRVQKLEEKEERRHEVQRLEEKEERKHGVEKLEEKEQRHGVEKLEDIADILLATSEEKHRHRRSSLHKKD